MPITCRNRHCPKCQNLARAEWLAARQAELLPVPYFHIVFTLPAPLAAIAFHNKAVVYDILMRSAAAALRTLAADPKHLGADIGVIAVLHTWGQNLQHHPHVHTIVPGGGVALLRASEHLKGLRTKNDDQKTGVEIVRKALSWPARQIAINAGEDGSVIVGKILENKTYAYGFDSQSGEYVNLISKGIIDPTKVVRVAIQNAASVAALLITTEAMVAELPKKNAGGGGMPPGGGMGGMGGMDF